MQHNDLKCGEIVDDFCKIPKAVCSMKEDWGANFGPFVQNLRIWA